MPQKVIKYRVFVASPSDVQEERQEAKHAIDHWNDLYSQGKGVMLQPVLWEAQVSPQMGGEPQAIIDRDALTDCDVLIGIFWTRLGTPTPTAQSGTVEEIEKVKSEGKEVLLFFKSAKERPPSFDQIQYDRLTAKKKEYQQAGIICDYKSLDEFKVKVGDAIYRAIERLRKGANWIIDYQHRHDGQLPPLPEYLLPMAIGYTQGQPISKAMDMRSASAQLWDALLPSQQEKFLQLCDWLGKDRRDYLKTMKNLWPNDVGHLKVTWRPSKQ